MVRLVVVMRLARHFYVCCELLQPLFDNLVKVVFTGDDSISFFRILAVY